MFVTRRQLVVLGSTITLFLFFLVLPSKSPQDLPRAAQNLRPADVPLSEPFIVIGTKTSPPFLITVYPERVDSFISKSLLQKGLHGDYLIFQRIFERYQNIRGLPFEPAFLDLGANIGFHSFQAASMGYKAYLFEPNPKNLDRIDLSIKLNNFEKLMKVFPFGVSDESGSATLKISHNSPGMGMLGDEKQVESDLEKWGVEMGGSDYEFDVKIVRLDDYIQHSVFFLKIDVEGWEYHALLGAKKLLRQHGVGIIEMEIFPAMLKAAGTSAEQLLNFVKDQGYTLYSLEGDLIDVATFSNSIKQDEHTDVIFINDRFKSKLGPHLWL